MTTTTKGFLLAAGLVSMSMLLGCASDPNKQASDAHDAELKSDRKQEQKSAEDRSDSRVKAAEDQREATEVTTGSKSAATANAKLTEARDAHRAKATARLEKADARTAELKLLVDKAGAKASTASRDSLKTVETQRTMAAKEVEQLPRIANDNWEQAKSSVDTQLDNLEGLVKKAADEVDKFKK